MKPFSVKRYLPGCSLMALALTAATPAIINAAPAKVVAASAAANAPTSPAIRVEASITDVQRQKAGAGLMRYQLALDQLAEGHITESRVLAEQARKSYGDTPEINLLLAYLLQREGRNDEASGTLDAVKDASPLASQFAAQLPHGAAPTDEGQPVATNAASTSRTTPAGATLPQSDARLAGFETYLIGKVNEERKKAGLVPLTGDSLLADTARAHSAEMRDLKYFAHESPTEGLHEPLDRYRAVFHGTPTIVAENIFRSWGSSPDNPHRLYQSDIDAAHDALMKSPGHRANILYRDVRRIGIGIAVNSTGDMWITQMFARN